MSIDFSKHVQPQSDPQRSPELALLAEQLEIARQREESAEREYKSAKKRREILETKTIPEKLAEMGIQGNGSKIMLVDGGELSLSEQTYVSIPAALKAAAYEWLRDNGFGAMVKEELKETVSTSGLRPMADELPDDLFNINVVKKVKIKR